jgi:hypothetical protein
MTDTQKPDHTVIKTTVKKDNTNTVLQKNYFLDTQLRRKLWHDIRRCPVKEPANYVGVQDTLTTVG